MSVDVHLRTLFLSTDPAAHDLTALSVASAAVGAALDCSSTQACKIPGLVDENILTENSALIIRYSRYVDPNLVEKLVTEEFVILWAKAIWPDVTVVETTVGVPGIQHSVVT